MAVSMNMEDEWPEEILSSKVSHRSTLTRKGAMNLSRPWMACQWKGCLKGYQSNSQMIKTQTVPATIQRQHGGARHARYSRFQDIAASHHFGSLVLKKKPERRSLLDSYQAGRSVDGFKLILKLLYFLNHVAKRWRLLWSVPVCSTPHVNVDRVLLF